MKIKPGDKLPECNFYLDDANEVKISTSDLFKSKKNNNFRYAWGFHKNLFSNSFTGVCQKLWLALTKGITKIICIAVNDPNAMKAWGQNQNVGNKIFMIGDPFCKFTKAIGAEVDKSSKV